MSDREDTVQTLPTSNGQAPTSQEQAAALANGMGMLVEHLRQVGEARLVFASPKEFAECRPMANAYVERSAVMLDLRATPDVVARRVVDFAAGLAFAFHGYIGLLEDRVYLLLP